MQRSAYVKNLIKPLIILLILPVNIAYAKYVMPHSAYMEQSEILTDEQRDILLEVKELSIEKVEELRTLINNDKLCLEMLADKNLTNECENFQKEELISRHTYLSQLNSKYRRLTGLINISKVFYYRNPELKWGLKFPFVQVNSEGGYRAHMLTDKSRGHLNVRELTYEGRERDNIIHKYNINQLQILRKYKKTMFHENINGYAIYNSLGLPTFFERKDQTDKQLLRSDGFSIYAKKENKELNAFYSYEVMLMISREPILLFINSRRLTLDSLITAYEHYNNYLMQRIDKLREVTDFNSLAELALIYDDIKKVDDRKNPERSVASDSEWDELIVTLKKIQKKQQSVKNIFSYALGAASLVTTFALPVPKAIAHAFTFGFLTMSAMDTNAAAKAIERNTGYWLGSLQHYQSIIDHNSEYVSNLIMTFFYGQPLVTGTISKGSQFFSLSRESLDSFKENLLSYLKTKAKAKAKKTASESVGQYQFNYEVYIEHNGEIIDFFLNSILDFEDFSMITSGCFNTDYLTCDVDYY